MTTTEIVPLDDEQWRVVGALKGEFAPEEIGHRPSPRGEETRLAQGYMRRDLTPILPTRQPEDPVPQGLPPGNGRVTTRYHPTGSALSKWRFSCLPLDSGEFRST